MLKTASSLRSLAPAVWRLAPLVTAGLVIEAGWLLFWAVSGQARITAESSNAVSTAARTAFEQALDLMASADQFVPDLTVPRLPVALALGGCLALLGCGYLATITLLHRKYARVRGAVIVVGVFAAVFQITLLLMPGVFTTDPFSYLIYGQVALNGLNPYISPPSSLSHNPLLEWVYPGWRSLPSPYGPLWTWISTLLASGIATLDTDDQLRVHMLVMNLVHVVNLGLVAWLVKRTLTRGRLVAFALFAWNPLALLELTGNGHNDGVMLTFLLAGLIAMTYTQAVLRGSSAHGARWLAAVFLIGLSAMVKYATFPVGIVAAVVWARGLRSHTARVLWLGAALLSVAAVGLALFWPWLDSPGVLGAALGEVNGQYQWHSAASFLTRPLTEVLTSVFRLEPTAAAQSARAGLYVVIRVAFVGYVLWELRRLWRAGHAQSAVRMVGAVSARLLLVYLLLVQTEVHTWYFTWPLVLVLPLGWRNTLTRVVIGYTLTSLVTDYASQFTIGPSAAELRELINACAVALPVVVVLLLRFHPSRRQHYMPAPIEPARELSTPPALYAPSLGR